INLKVTDTRLAYIFILEKNTQSYCFSEDGLTEYYHFDTVFYNFFQMPYSNQIDIFPTVDGWKESTFYQIFIDRFAKCD
ncbi:alpha amylase N-terminal ig-like domain-containing protein, partial [Streptococcus suis]